MAKRGVNKVILVGNLGQDPETKYLPSGNAVTNLTLATSESYKDKNTGEQKETTEWHRVAIFGKLAEIAGEYLRKGSQVYFEGKLQTRKWTDQQGQERYTTEVMVDSFDGVMQILGSKAEGQQSAPQQNNQNQNQGYNNNQGQQGGYGNPQGNAQNQGGYQQPQQGGYQQGANQQQGGFAPKAAQPPVGDDGIDFDDDIPF